MRRERESGGLTRRQPRSQGNSSHPGNKQRHRLPLALRDITDCSQPSLLRRKAADRPTARPDPLPSRVQGFQETSPVRFERVQGQRPVDRCPRHNVNVLPAHMGSEQEPLADRASSLDRREDASRGRSRELPRCFFHLPPFEGREFGIRRNTRRPDHIVMAVHRLARVTLEPSPVGRPSQEVVHPLDSCDRTVFCLKLPSTGARAAYRPCLRGATGRRVGCGCGPA